MPCAIPDITIWIPKPDHDHHDPQKQQDVIVSRPQHRRAIETRAGHCVRHFCTFPNNPPSLPHTLIMSMRGVTKPFFLPNALRIIIIIVIVRQSSSSPSKKALGAAPLRTHLKDSTNTRNNVSSPSRQSGRGQENEDPAGRRHTAASATQHSITRANFKGQTARPAADSGTVSLPVTSMSRRATKR